MANDKFVTVILTESDVPGDKLVRSDVATNSCVQLKRWLECRGLPVSGKKGELRKRSVLLVYTHFTI